MKNNVPNPYSGVQSDLHLAESEGISRQMGLFPWVLAVIVFSLPLETLLPHYFGIRSHVYYLTILALALSALYLKQLVQNFSRSKGLLLLFLSFFWTILIYFLSPFHYNSEYVLLVQQILFCFLLLYIANSPVWRIRLIWLYWAGWVLLCIISLQYYLAGNVDTVDYSKLGIERIIGVLSFSAAQHGAQIATGFMVALILFFNQKKSFTKALLFGSLLLGSIVVIMTASRTAVISLLLTIITYFLVEVEQKRNKFIQANLVPIITLLLGMFFVFSQTDTGSSLMNPFIKRINLTVQTGDTTGRSNLAWAAWELAKENPILGIGQGNSVLAMGRYSIGHSMGVDVHNYYLRMLVEGGWVGLTLFLTGLFLIVRQGWRWYQFSGESFYFYPLLLLLIIAFGGRPFHYKILWFFFAFNALTPALGISNIFSSFKK